MSELLGAMEPLSATTLLYWLNACTLVALICVLLRQAHQSPQWSGFGLAQRRPQDAFLQSRWWWHPFNTMAAVLGLFLLQYILRLITDVPGGLSGFYVELLRVLTVSDFLIAVGLVICAIQILSPVPPSNVKDGKSLLMRVAHRVRSLPWPVASLAFVSVLSGGLAVMSPDLTWRALLCPTSTAFGLWSFCAAIVSRFQRDKVHRDLMITVCLAAVILYGAIQFVQVVVVLDAAGQSSLDGRSFETFGMILSLAAKFALALSLAFLRDEQYIVLIRSIPQGVDLSGLFVQGWPRVVREAAETVQTNMMKMVRDTFHQLGNLKIVIGAIDRLEEEYQIAPDLLHRLRYANSLYTTYLLAIACYDQRLGRFKASEFDLVQTIDTVLASFDMFDPQTISQIYEADNFSALKQFERTNDGYRYFDFKSSEPKVHITGFNEALMACVRELVVNALRHGVGPRPKIVLECVNSTICCRITNRVKANDLSKLKSRLQKRPFGWAAAQSIAREAGGQLRDEWNEANAEFTAILEIPIYFNREQTNGSDDIAGR